MGVAGGRARTKICITNLDKIRGEDMPKNKPSNWGTSGGDWSDTGTFVRKPSTGWLHRESELTNGSYVRYKLNVSIILVPSCEFTLLVFGLCRDYRVNEITTVSSKDVSNTVIRDLLNVIFTDLYIVKLLLN